MTAMNLIPFRLTVVLCLIALCAVWSCAETGVVGLVLFLAITGIVLRRLWIVRSRWSTTRPEYADLATGIGLGLMAYLGTGVFLSLAFQRYFWLLVALAGVAVHVYGSGRERKDGGEAVS